MIFQPLGRMVANLFQAHQGRQHHALALNSLGPLQRLGQVRHRLLVEGRLLAAQGTMRLDLGLVRQVGDDRLVRLHPAQDIGAHQVAQGAIGIVGTLRQSLGIGGELSGRPEKAGVDEIKDRPKVTQVVLDRGPGQRDARPRLQDLGRPGLLGVRVLDGLGLVEDEEVPACLRQHRQPQERAIAGDRQIQAREPVRR